MFKPELPSLASEIVEEIRSTIPEYARPLNGPYGRSIQAGVQYAIGLFVDQIIDPECSAHECHDVHRKLGQNEMREGRSLDALQAAHRVGARVAWRRIMSVGKRNGLSSLVMSQLADRLFAFMDELASVALDGYLEAKACTAGALETWRRRLLRLVLEQPPAPARAIAELAQLTGWVLPAEVTVIAAQPLPGTGHNQRRPILDGDILAELDGMEPHLLVPGELTGSRLARIRPALAGARLAVGPCVPLDSAADSLRWARRGLVLAEEGLLGAGRVVFCADHLATLLVHSDPPLVAQLERRLFAPLEGLTARQRERMLETLRAWLDAQGSVPDIATRLTVHPQTVRYRMRQLETAFGGLLEDPDARFQLEIVLRAAATAPRPAPPPAEGLGELLPAPRTSVRQP
ncbi:MAG TPA: helix-turn-helix domain-containing protein [Pseudonocardiaceae bacterium]